MARIRALFLFLQLVILTIGTISAFTIVKDLEEGFETEIRDKRDVLKGKNGHDNNLIRSKRYIGRVPVAYMKKVNLQPYDVEEEHSAGNNAQPVSHFREFQPNENTHHAQRRFAIPRGSAAAGIGDLDTSNLSDDEIQTLLLMLDGYDLNSMSNTKGHVGRMGHNAPPSGQYYSRDNRLPPLDPDRVAQMYNVGKRETDEDRIEFLGDDARSKRTGARHLMNTNRVKKETDQSALSSLDRVFSDDNTNLARNFLNKPKTKKDIDWSNYLGIDKRNSKQASEQPAAAAAVATSKDVSPVKSIPIAMSMSNSKMAAAQPQPNKLVSIPLTSTSTKTGKDNKKEQERKENETVDKDDDRQWVLDEFYKNFAMMTNVKRKRESPSAPSANSNGVERLEELEKQMTQVGDKIIWDALKYTGSHRDQDMSPQELAKVKASIIDKLATAYSLEKVREAVDELRQKIAAVDNIPAA